MTNKNLSPVERSIEAVKSHGLPYTLNRAPNGELYPVALSTSEAATRLNPQLEDVARFAGELTSNAASSEIAQ